MPCQSDSSLDVIGCLIGAVVEGAIQDSEDWEDKGIADAPLKVAAYATELPEFMVNRSPADRQRQVAEIKIGSRLFIA